MSTLKIHKGKSAGFTIPEILITIVIIGIVLAMAIPIFMTTFKNYFGLQYTNEQFTSIASQSQRIANVIRGLTDINTANGNDMDIYAYFYPNDAYVSKVNYYLSADQAILYADVTPMTANPPLGTPITANKKTYTIINNYKKLSGVNLFEYIDQSGNTMGLPISDTEAIKSIKINLAVKKDIGTDSGEQTMPLSVSLRNRKTNL